MTGRLAGGAVSARGDIPAVPDFRMDGVSYTQIALQGSFLLRAPLGDDWRLYLVRGREIVFEADDSAQTRLLLAPGSILALSGVLQHRFLSPPPHAGPLTEWTETALQVDALAQWPSLAIGRIPKSHLAFLAMFERVFVISSTEHSEVVGRIAHAVDAIAHEVARPGPEADVIVRKISEIIVLEVGRFRRLLAESNERSARQAESDPRILRAISAFYSAPEQKWTLERLAATAGMSRTAFAVRYRELIGATPAKSLRQLRMQIATRQLAETAARPRLEKTALQVGYGSSGALVRAFTREFGITPRKMVVGQARPSVRK